MGIHYVFKALTSKRTRLGSIFDELSASVKHFMNMSTRMENCANLVQRRRDAMQNQCSNQELEATSGYADIASSKLKEQIVRDWQSRFKTEYYGRKACAVCSLSELKSGTKFEWCSVPYDDLVLLRNEHLPASILPDAYCLDKYNGAILNAKGLMTLNETGPLLLCKKCESDVIGKQMLPELSLANWLYYGHSSLPQHILQAFNGSSAFEKMLVARCTASKIIHRFSDKQDSPVFGQPSVSSQRYSQGNTIVLPQDSVGLNRCLPPDPEMVRDTMCALFVGQEKPTADNVVRLSPILIRRSRLKTMIDFLLNHNPQYKVSDSFLGFSQTNLDALFSPANSADLQVPIGLQEEFLPSSPAINSTISAGITDRDAADSVNSQLSSSAAVQLDSDILMENVGYTDGDFSSASYKKMKVDALQYCLSGRTYIHSQRGNTPIPDFYNPSLLTWLFPHLDPYGIGGFYEPRRKRKISMDKQLRHLIMMDDSPFEKDANFAFVFYNIIQKREAVKSANFRVRCGQHMQLVESLKNLPPTMLGDLSSKYRENPQLNPSSDTERNIFQTLECLKLVCKDLPGSAAYKQCRRNDIRGLINRFGSPALFVTINPSDVNHPLVRLLTGDDIDLEDATVGELLDKFQRKIKVANNPAAAALFFDSMIQGFIDTILRWKKGKGLFGTCKAYYGMVEAQGKGTLHCHLLIWLHGHLSPLELRDKMQSDPDFKDKLFRWLESIIRCELPGTAELVVENDGPLKQPEREGTHPTLLPAPIIGPDESWDEFESNFNDFVTKIVIEHNWHVHNATCWKYLKPSEPHDDAHCRMRMNGQTNCCTHLDAETLSIILRRLHPRISNYNDVLSFLLKCNNDIKFIGSGEAAQALIFYITDYITKTSLATHAGLAALAYAVQKEAEQAQSDDFNDSRAKSLVMKVVNAMMSRQELSHQQIMSYIVGNGDCYKSHTFVILHWGMTRHAGHN